MTSAQIAHYVEMPAWMTASGPPVCLAPCRVRCSAWHTLAFHVVFAVDDEAGAPPAAEPLFNALFHRLLDWLHPLE